MPRSALQRGWRANAPKEASPLWVNFFTLLAQPPISPHDRASNQHRACIRASAAIKRSKTRKSPCNGWKNVSIVEHEHGVGLGFSMGESPQKIGWWGAKRVEERR